MTEKRRPEYTKLTLGGYQTFAETTELPLGRLTFLFGPNSAGKSAVEDGFNLFSELIDSKKSFAITGAGGFDRLEKHFRRMSDDPLKFSPFLKIGLSANVSTDAYRHGFSLLLQQFDEKKANKYVSKQHTHTVEYQAEFPLNEDLDKDWSDGPEWRTGHCIEFLLNEKPLLYIHMQQRMGLNLAHPLMKILGILQNIKSVPPELGEVATFEKKWLWVKGGFQIQSNGEIEDQFPISDDMKQATAKAVAAFPDFKPTLEKLLKVLSALFEVRFSLVHASRRIPSEKDLLFISDARKGEFDYAKQLENYPIPGMGDDNYRVLAESLIAPTTTDLTKWDLWEDDRDASDLGELVNRALSEHLFLERGYRVAADYRLLLSREQYGALKSCDTSSTPGEYPVLIRLFLSDSQGREFSFSDVGSGLGYVLPVLVSLFGDQKVSILQQPELHLHPALQAAMGDVLIDACNQGKQVIVETHSEHVLLRVLKRIRQTSTGQPLAEELQIAPDDISVLYFDPSPDGTTKVKQLRVSPDGDFLDPWPRGFFAERDQELFDE